MQLTRRHWEIDCCHCRDADGAVPFVMDGWLTVAGQGAYAGWLVRNGETVYVGTSDKEYTWSKREK